MAYRAVWHLLTACSFFLGSVFALLHLIPTSVIPSQFIRIVQRSTPSPVCLYFTPQQLAHRDLYIAIPNGWKTHRGYQEIHEVVTTYKPNVAKFLKRGYA